jgi:hypothetical protein
MSNLTWKAYKRNYYKGIMCWFKKSFKASENENIQEYLDGACFPDLDHVEGPVTHPWCEKDANCIHVSSFDAKDPLESFCVVVVAVFMVTKIEK